MLHLSSAGCCTCLAKYSESPLVVRDGLFVKFDTVKTNCHIKLKTYQIIDKDSVIEEGIIYRRNYIPCNFSFDKNGYVIKFGKMAAHEKPPYKLFCSQVSQRKIFNNRKNGKRIGIWVRFYPWGKIRKIVLYEERGPTKISIYRPNGFMIRYNSSFRPDFDIRMHRIHYDKEGNSHSLLPGFWP